MKKYCGVEQKAAIYGSLVVWQGGLRMEKLI